MIEEAYCSFEVATLLKEKGFKEKVRALWIGTIHPYLSVSDIKEDDYNSGGTDLCSSPTHQMAMAWVREKGFTFIISPQWAEGDMRNPCRWYWEIRGLKDNTVDVYSQPLCSTYEEAVETALKYVLTNLI